jgi:hypothetical protein
MPAVMRLKMLIFWETHLFALRRMSGSRHSQLATPEQ